MSSTPPDFVIEKFEITNQQHQTISMNAGASVMKFDTERGQPTMWALCVPDRPKVERYMVVAFDEDPIKYPPPKHDLYYHGSTRVEHSGKFMHLFECVPKMGSPLFVMDLDAMHIANELENKEPYK